LRINHNISALNTYRRLSVNNVNGSKAIEKLSSGQRINRAGDDAAGLAISEKMRGQIKGLEMASKNTQNGISLIQTVEGALNETHSILQRMRELSVEASNDTQTNLDRAELQKEIIQLTTEIDRISDSTEFNSKKLLNGDRSKLTDARGDILQSSKLEYSDLDRSSGYGENIGQQVAVKSGVWLRFEGDSGISGNVLLDKGNYTYTQLETMISGKLGSELNLNRITVKVSESGSISFNSWHNYATCEVWVSGTGASGYLGLNEYSNRSNISPNSFLRLDNIDTFLEGKGTLVTDSNNMFTVSKNGGSEIVIFISGGLYSGEDLAAEVDYALSGAGISGIEATFSGGSIKFTILDNIDKSEYEISTSSTSGLSGIGRVHLTNEKDANITDLKNSNGDNLNVLSGSIIKVKGDFRGKGQIEVMIEVSGSTRISDLSTAIASGIASQISGVSSNELDVSLTSGGRLQVQGKKGESNSITGFLLSIDDNDKFNNTFSNFQEIQDASDVTTNDSLILHIGANGNQTVKVDINEMSSEALNITSLDIGSQQGAENSIEVVDSAIEAVSAERAKLGAYQNRLEYAVNNLVTSSENLTAAESRIKDVDMAKEMMLFTKNNIITQAAQSMLSQVNQRPQGVLQLLR
jgi:flagellin